MNFAVALAHEQMHDADDAPYAAEAIRVLGGGFSLEKRSATLDGAVPLRAAQSCSPYLEGNSAGFHIQLSEPAVLEVEDGHAFLQMTDELWELVHRDYHQRIEKAVQSGYLARDGYWHRHIREGLVWEEDGVLNIWTGWLVRPAGGSWLLVGAPRNRRCFVDQLEYVVPESDRYVPLVLRVVVATLPKEAPTWIDTDVGCVLPLRPDVDWSCTTLDETPEAGLGFSDFYDIEKEGVDHAKLYRAKAAEATDRAVPGPVICNLVRTGGDELDTIDSFDLFATSEGWISDHPERGRLSFVTVGNLADVTWRYDGVLPREWEVDLSRDAPEFLNRWRRVLTDKAMAVLEPLLHYVRSNSGGQRHEPIWTIHHWSLIMTPPGWSSFIDAAHSPGVEGLRGVVTTDFYHGLAPVYLCQRRGAFFLPKGAPVCRVLPVPRLLLKAGLRTMTF